jgi:aspartyl-tRNA(Asn)/glutamyl-tRNA(Gln) amidotransferase subunit C
VTITPEDLARIARLAELDIGEADLTRLAGELDGIVAYVGQLTSLAASDDRPAAGHPEGVALRDDRVDPIPLDRPPADFAPEFQDGFFLVPRLPAMDGG